MFLRKLLLFYIENNNALKIICAEICQDEEPGYGNISRKTVGRSG